MKIIQSNNFHIGEPTAVAIGKFDGVHLGHRKLIEELQKQKYQQTNQQTPLPNGQTDGHRVGPGDDFAERQNGGLKTAIFTFDPSPAVFFDRTHRVRELMTREEKRRCFATLGIDYLVEFPLTKETAAMAPEVFVRDVLAGQMQARFVAAGDDLSFGDRGRGNFALLRELAPRYGFACEEVEKVRVGGTVVSSTYIRLLVEQGRMDDAAAFLGEPYSVLGTIVHGNQLGRTIGIPTINQVPQPSKLLPPFGVYYSDVIIGDGAGREQVFHGMTNIGIKPTVSGRTAPGRTISGRTEAAGFRNQPQVNADQPQVSSDQPPVSSDQPQVSSNQPPVTVETYLYDFHGDVYGDTAVTKIYTFRRPERKFSGIDALQQAMESDIEAGREYFREKK